MKKIIFASLCMACIALFASCDTKLCYCYQQTGSHVTESETYVDLSTRCNDLSTSIRHCVESSQRMDPNGMASEFATRTKNH